MNEHHIATKDADWLAIEWQHLRLVGMSGVKKYIYKKNVS